MVIVDWIGLGQSASGLGWIGFSKMDPCPTLSCTRICQYPGRVPDITPRGHIPRDCPLKKILKLAAATRTPDLVRLSPCTIWVTQIVWEREEREYIVG